MIRRKLAMVAVLAGALTCAPLAQAKDACTTVMCMAGMLMGSGGGSSCTDAIKDYFSILEYHHGHIEWSQTSKSRLSFLQGCSSGGSWPKSINSVYGAVSG